MEEKLDGVEKDARSLDDASLSVTDEKAVLTINGTKVPTNESTAVQKQQTQRKQIIQQQQQNRRQQISRQPVIQQIL